MEEMDSGVCVCVCVCVGVFRALQLLRLLSALIVYASSAQLRTGIINDVKTDAT